MAVLTRSALAVPYASLAVIITTMSSLANARVPRIVARGNGVYIDGVAFLPAGYVTLSLIIHRDLAVL